MFEDMFSNVGDKIKIVAKIFFMLELIASVIGGIYVMTYGGVYVLFGLLTAVAGVLVAWASALFIFGFGQLISNTDRIKAQTKTTEVKQAEISKSVDIKSGSKSASEDNYVDLKCPSCKATLSYKSSFLEKQSKVTCPMCDAEIEINKK